MNCVRTAFLLTIVAAGCAGGQAAQDDGWVSLYNGKDLSGWGYLKNGKCTLSVCAKDGKTSSREVVIGKSDGKMTQIKSGLEAGEKVAVSK